MEFSRVQVRALHAGLAHLPGRRNPVWCGTDKAYLLIGKGFDTFCPLGPVIATGLDLDDLLLEARINGETRQSIRTNDLLFSTVDIVQYPSQAITFQPGDIIITGTPSGVGSIKPGDQMEIIMEGVGVLSNPVVAESR